MRRGGTSVAAPTVDVSPDHVQNIVNLELHSSSEGKGREMYQLPRQKNVNNNPLEWWRTNIREHPGPGALARRVLAIPASQAL